MATDKQVKYVESLQNQTSLTDYSRKEIKAMTHKSERFNKRITR